MPKAPYDLYHAYIYTTSIWYLIRGCARTLAPETVFRWFEASPRRAPTSLELYNIRTDALLLLLAGALLLTCTGLTTPFAAPLRAAPLPKTAVPLADAAWLATARAALAATVAQHAGTAALAYAQWADERTATRAMLLGWAFSAGVAALGGAAWLEVERAARGAAGRASRRRSRSTPGTPRTVKSAGSGASTGVAVGSPS